MVEGDLEAEAVYIHSDLICYCEGENTLLLCET